MAQWPTLRTIRIASGLVLFAYVTTHLLNHAVGLVSLEAMEAAAVIFRAVWRSVPLTILLYGALAVHVLAALFSIARKPLATIPIAERVQILSGIAVPILLAPHVFGTRGSHEVFGFSDTYSTVLLYITITSPWAGVTNVLGLIVSWVHGCLGIAAWARSRSWWTGVRSQARIAAIVFPLLALAGVLSASRDVSYLQADDGWLEARYTTLTADFETLTAFANDATAATRLLVAVLAFAVVLTWLVKAGLARRKPYYLVQFADGTAARAPIGTTLLEASRLNRIPHASVCGGRGRCSTCRLRVLETQTALPMPDETERRVLARVGAGASIRLACQLRPTADLRVVPLFPPDISVSAAMGETALYAGTERTVAILFADIRGFSRISEDKLPYDVVYLLNQFDRSMGQAIEAAGGHIDKFIGDGIMAIFGLTVPPEQASTQAIDAAIAMSEALDELNARVGSDLVEALRIGVGIHTGRAVIGHIGYADARTLTAIGDTVNTASRLEAATKELGVEFVVSERTVALSGRARDLSGLEQRAVTVRGRTKPVTIYAVPRAKDLRRPN